MLDPLAIDFKVVSDESLLNRDGTVTKVRRYDFYIGKHGPFTERVPLDTFTDSEIQTRVGRLKAHLQNLPR
jgi:hypothetical protein